MKGKGKVNFRKINKYKLLIVLLLLLIILVAIANQQKSRVSQTPNQSYFSKPSDSNLTDPKNFLLNPPKEGSSKDLFQAHAQIVATYANEAKFLEIKDCKPNPLVLKVKQGSKFEIKNMDNVKRKIIIDSQHFYDIEANDSRTITAQFKYGTGDYGYVCDEVGIVGFLHVTK